MSYYSTVAMTLSRMFVRGVSELAEFLVAVKRLEGFMVNDEFVKDTERISEKCEKIEQCENMLIFCKVSAKWCADSPSFALSDVNFKVPRGCLLGVIGPVGSGKSSLLQTILGYSFSLKKIEPLRCIILQVNWR